jgi:hypothetical protein
MEKCNCGSFAINLSRHGRDGTDTDLCDVCYWRKRGEKFDYAVKELEFYKPRLLKLARLEKVIEKFLKYGLKDDFGRFDFVGELLHEYNK